MRERVTLVDGHGVGHSVSRVEDDTSRASGRVKRKDGLDRDVEGRRVEGLEHDCRTKARARSATRAGAGGGGDSLCVIFSRLTLGLRGASVRRTGCSSGATRSSL